jgi:imidazolonepropionase-like amidohydrolase
MRAAIKAGIKFAVGTDGMHGGLAQEIQYLLDFGATPSQALMAATRHAAMVCGLEESIGTLEPGKFADIIGVDGNPVEDIPSLKRVKTVVSMGEIKHQANQ